MAQGVVERFGGVVPEPLDDLVTLPGVGRKTANVVRSVAFGLPGLPVDTHVGRLSRRLGLTTEDDPVRVELDLNRLVPAAERGAFSLRLILHGRKVCTARKPHCTACLLADICPSAAILGPAKPWSRPSPGAEPAAVRPRGDAGSPRPRRQWVRKGCRKVSRAATFSIFSSKIQLSAVHRWRNSGDGVVRWLQEPVPATWFP